MVEGMKTTERRMLFLLIAVDVILLVGSLYVSTYLRLGYWINVFDKYTGASGFTVLVCLTNFYIFELYELSGGVRRANFAVRYILALVSSAILLPLVFYSLPFWKLGRGILLLTVIIFSSLALLWRLLFEISSAKTIKPNRIALVGRRTLGEELASILANRTDFEVVRIVSDDAPNIGEELESIAGKGMIDSVSLDIDLASSRDILKSLLKCKLMKVDIFDMNDLYETLVGKIPISQLTESKLVNTTFKGMRRNLYMSTIKRLVDLGLSMAGLVMALPIILVTSFFIKLTSRGPVLFRQNRVGLDGEIFEVLKFRSMRLDAEEDGAVWALEEDPRVTLFGRVLRKTRIDEIPQMWNVLKGQMSFIGPRPERPEFVQDLNRTIPFYALRHSVKPGITGWAQINYRYGASVEDAFEKLQYDLFYIKNLSMMLDLQILLKTIKVILFGSGAR